MEGPHPAVLRPHPVRGAAQSWGRRPDQSGACALRAPVAGRGVTSGLVWGGPASGTSRHLPGHVGCCVPVGSPSGHGGHRLDVGAPAG